MGNRISRENNRSYSSFPWKHLSGSKASGRIGPAPLTTLGWLASIQGQASPCQPASRRRHNPEHATPLLHPVRYFHISRPLGRTVTARLASNLPLSDSDK